MPPPPPPAPQIRQAGVDFRRQCVADENQPLRPYRRPRLLITGIRHNYPSNGAVYRNTMGPYSRVWPGLGIMGLCSLRVNWRLFQCVVCARDQKVCCSLMALVHFGCDLIFNITVGCLICFLIGCELISVFLSAVMLISDFPLVGI